MSVDDLVSQGFRILDAIENEEVGRDNKLELVSQLRDVIARLGGKDETRRIEDVVAPMDEQSQVVMSGITNGEGLPQGMTMSRYAFSSEVNAAGFYDVEKNSVGRPFRWAGKQRSASIFLNNERRDLRWVGLLAAPVSGVDLGPETLWVSVNGIASPYVLKSVKNRSCVLVEVRTDWPRVEILFVPKQSVAIHGRQLTIAIHEIVEVRELM